MEFTTKLNKSDVRIDYMLFGVIKEELRKELDIYTTCSATVKWSMEIEAREYGVKSIILSVTNVTVDIDWEVSDEDVSVEETAELTKPVVGGSLLNNGMISGHALLNVTLSSKDWKIDDRDFTFKSDSVQPEEVTVDFKDKTITISN
jgi:hypothetical protein